MADRDQIVSFLNELLDIGAYPDGMPVGMQVPGAAQVRRVATGVSASLELFQRAAQDGADMLIVHHGLFFGSGPRPPLSEQDRAAEDAVRPRHHAGRLPPGAGRAPAGR